MTLPGSQDQVKAVSRPSTGKIQLQPQFPWWGEHAKRSVASKGTDDDHSGLPPAPSPWYTLHLAPFLPGFPVLHWWLHEAPCSWFFFLSGLFALDQWGHSLLRRVDLVRLFPSFLALSLIPHGPWLLAMMFESRSTEDVEGLAQELFGELALQGLYRKEPSHSMQFLLESLAIFLSSWGKCHCHLLAEESASHLPGPERSIWHKEVLFQYLLGENSSWYHERVG